MGRKKTYIEVRERPWNMGITVHRSDAGFLNKKGIDAKCAELQELYPEKTHSIVVVKTTQELCLIDKSSQQKEPPHSIIEPSPGFVDQVKRVCGITWTVTGLQIVDHRNSLFSARFMLSRYNSRKPQQVEVGPRASIPDLQNRVIEFLTA